MISLYTDEDVDVLIKPLLQAKGFNVLSTLDEGMLGKSDREQIEHAIKLQRVFITHNRLDFEKLAIQFIEEGKTHYGIILATRRNVYEMTRRLARFLELHKRERIRDQIWYI